MVRRKWNGKRPSDKHKNVLVPSTKDQQVCCVAVNEKYIEMCGLCRRINGADLKPPESLLPDIYRWRQMFVRHNTHGDFRHTEEELRSMEAIAQFTLNTDKELRGQDPPPKLVFNWEVPSGA